MNYFITFFTLCSISVFSQSVSPEYAKANESFLELFSEVDGYEECTRKNGYYSDKAYFNEVLSCSLDEVFAEQTPKGEKYQKIKASIVRSLSSIYSNKPDFELCLDAYGFFNIDVYFESALDCTQHLD